MIWFYLDDNQQADSGSNVAGLSVHASHDVDDTLTQGDHHSEN